MRSVVLVHVYIAATQLGEDLLSLFIFISQAGVRAQSLKSLSSFIVRAEVRTSAADLVVVSHLNDVSLFEKILPEVIGRGCSGLVFWFFTLGIQAPLLLSTLHFRPSLHCLQKEKVHSLLLCGYQNPWFPRAKIAQ